MVYGSTGPSIPARLRGNFGKQVGSVAHEIAVALVATN